MIQRIQTLWLFIAAICAALTFKFPFYTGNTTAKDGTLVYERLTASSNLILIILTACLTMGILILIFMYKTRTKQMWLTIAAAGVSIINLVLYFMDIKNFSSGSISLTSILSFAIPIFLLLAARGVWKDEKLIKSLDRLR